jgi:hypothetical protein
MGLWKVIDNKIYPKWATIGIILLLISYEGKSISTSQMDINVKNAILEPGKNTHFSIYPPPTLMHFSHCFTSALKRAT